MARWLIVGLLFLGYASPPKCCSGDEDAFAPAIEYAQKRLVKIYGGKIGRTPGYATGIIVSDEGDILTAQGAQLATNALKIVLPDGESHLATVARRSQDLQTVLLKIEAKTPDYFPLAASPRPQRGDWILAISNAFRVAEGTEPLSVNFGVVSLRTRLEARRGVQDFPYHGDVILIDAITSNPGAAGGAIVDTQGKLLGMIGKTIEGKTTNTRLNHAVPVDLLAEFVARTFVEHDDAATQASNSAKVLPGEIGIRLFALGGRREPAYVDRVLPGSPAERAGIRTDDLVVGLNGKPVRSAADFKVIVESLKFGQQLVLQVKRKNELLTFPLIAAGK